MAAQIGIKRRRQYDPENMALAISAVRDDGVPKRQACRIYGVPRTTLLDKLAGRVPEVGNSGPQPVLTKGEESTLVTYITLMGKIGYPITRKSLVNEVKKILDFDGRSTPFKDNLPGN